MRIDIAAETHIGRRKDKNEDYYGCFQEDTLGLRLFRHGALLCVADGLGGHSRGEIASKLAVKIMKEMLKQPSPAPPENGQPDRGPLPLICQWIARANTAVFQTNRDYVKEDLPMGTTLLAAVVTDKRVYIGNVGDSRAYHIRDGEIIEKTEDHSWVDEQVKQGLMSKAEAEADARRNIVTRSIGTHPEVQVDSYIWHTVPGDVILLCTDGLINMVKDSEIADQFGGNASPAEIAHRLVNRANEHGGRDNITVIVADIAPSPVTVMRRRMRAFSKRRSAKILWFTLLLLYGVLCFAGGYLFARYGPELF